MKQRLLMLLCACCITIAGLSQDKPKTELRNILGKVDTLLRKVDENPKGNNELDCCKGSSWGDRTYTLNNVKKTLPTATETNLGAYKCNEKADFKTCYTCASGCEKASIEYQVYRYGTMNFISTNTVTSCTNYSVTMPSTAGYYGININASCNGKLCKALTYYFNVECPDGKDSLILINPSPYCPSKSIKPVFNWVDNLKDETKYSYNLKVVEMNKGDTKLTEFDNRKTLFEIKSIKKNELKFPDKVESLKMGRLYAYRVQKYLGEKLLAQSEIFPFIVIDQNLPFVSEMLCCQANLIQNGSFTEGCVPGVLDKPGKVDNWKTSYGSPVVAKSEDGCGAPNYIQIKGNSLIGAAIEQTVPIQKGKHYKLSACVRVCKDSKSDFVFINAVAFNGNLASTGQHPTPSATVAKIGWSGKIKGTQWITFSMQVWTPSINFQKLAIYCTSENEGIVCAEIDKICLQETNDSIPCDDFQYSDNGSVIIPEGLANADIRNRDTTYYENHRGRLVDLYPGYNGTTSFYQTNEPCSSIGGTIPNEVLNFNMDDSLANIGLEGGIAELDSILNTIIKDTTASTTLLPIAPLTGLCERSYIPDPSQPFSGRDIIFVHGLNLSHLCERASGIPGAQKNWPNDASEFYGTGYYHQKAVDTWSDHINEWLKTRGYKNRYLVVAYNNSQRADVAAHAILTQIREAMQNGTGVYCPSNNPNPKWCFGKDAVIISHSTGALVTDIAMAIAEKSKTDPIVQARFGNVGFIPNNIKAHLAPHGAFRGSKMATVFLATQSALGINSPIANITGCAGYSLLDPLKMSTTAYQSILVDLQPAVATALWMPIINSFNKVTTITLAGGHSIGTYEMGNYPFINIAMHPGFDDGVLTMGCQSANPWFETGPFPVGFNRQLPAYKLFDMGVAFKYSFDRAKRYFLHQTLFTSPPFVSGASTAYLSPTGMVQPVSTIPPITNPENRMPNHFSFLQSASDHYVGPRGRSKKEGYVETNHNGTSGYRTNNYNYYYNSYEAGKHWEESLVITNSSVFTNGYINPAVINLPEEVVRGEYLDFDVWGPAFYFKSPFQIIIKWEPMFHVHITLWERKYHLMSDTETECEMGYMYKYILR